MRELSIALSIVELSTEEAERLGFRPFVFSLAERWALRGRVFNNGAALPAGQRDFGRGDSPSGGRLNSLFTRPYAWRRRDHPERDRPVFRGVHSNRRSPNPGARRGEGRLRDFRAGSALRGQRRKTDRGRRRRDRRRGRRWPEKASLRPGCLRHRRSESRAARNSRSGDRLWRGSDS